MNRVIEDTLRCYIQRQEDWEKWLPYVEIAINNSEASSTGKSPYFSNYGFHPQFQTIRNVSDNEVRVPKAAEFINDLENILGEIKSKLRAAIDRQTSYANTRRRELSFDEGENVMLSTRNIPLQTGVRKLTDRFIGPYLNHSN